MKRTIISKIEIILFPFFQSIKCEICEGITKGIKILPRSDYRTRLKYLLNSEPPGAYITTRENLRIAIGFDPLSFYLAMNEKSNLFNDYLALAVRKNSSYKIIFDEL